MRGFACLALALAGAWAATAAEAPTDASPNRVQRLIDRLGSGAFREREAASRELDTLGSAALDGLREAARSGDPETRRRASELVDRINERLAIARVLLPTMLEFSFKDKPLQEAVAELGRKSGAAIGLHDPNPAKFKNRTVTAATPGPVPFFEAIELFCRKADLHEWDGFTTVQGLAAPVQHTSGFMQVQGQVIVRSGRGLRSSSPSQFSTVLLDGPGGAFPSHRAGAVRIRALPSTTQFPQVTASTDEMILPLQISAEPKLSWQGASDLRIDRAIDESGQPMPASAVLPMIPGDEDDLIFVNGMVMSRPAQRAGPVGVRIRKPDRGGKRIAELSGCIAANVRVSEQMVRVEAPLKAAGQTYRGAHDVNLRLISASRANDGDIAVVVEVHMPQAIQIGAAGFGALAGGAIQFQAGVVVRQAVIAGAVNGPQPAPAAPTATEFMGLTLEDANGRRFLMVRGNQESTRFATDGYTIQFNVTFRPSVKEQEAAQLAFTASRPATVEVPFAIRDVPLQ